MSKLIPSIRSNATRFRNLTDEQIRLHSLGLKYDAMRGKLDARLPEVFGIVTEVMRRHLGKELYDVQLLAGVQMAKGSICEMKTGEGKTLAAALPAYFYGLSGLGCHVVTVNDYLAERDHALLKPMFDALGLSHSVLTVDQPPPIRAACYRTDVTYGTAKEFGFDFLRDRLRRRDEQRSPQSMLLRDLHAVVIDEADSVLLDEARTPLIIGTTDTADADGIADCHAWAALHADRFRQGVHFVYDELRNRVSLTTSGLQLMGQLPQTRGTRAQSTLELKQFIETAIHVRQKYFRGKHYALRDDVVVIIDEYTGRPAEGRQWQDGIHQAIEAKEGIEISARTEAAASVTVQHFFRLYEHMCGMTGTALAAKNELKRVYRKQVVAIPTHRPVRRKRLATRVFVDMAAKYAAVVQDIREQCERGRAVLVGTRSVEASEMLSTLLRDADIEHHVLNASHLPEEAAIVAGAGYPRAVTVATNMAGRGTDIQLHPTVADAGGLHVILTEMHESERVDLQLIGRCSRQGDPGSYRIFVSLDDELLVLGLGEISAARLRARMAVMQDANGELPRTVFRRFLTAQRRTERKHLTDRMILLRYEQEQAERMFESGQDIYLDTLR